MDDKHDVLDHVMRLMRLTRRFPMGERRTSHSEERVLMALKDNSGASSRELAEVLDVRPSSLSESLDKLEERGDVQRTRDEQDSRVIRVSLTEQGQRELLLNQEANLKSRQEFSACFTEEEKRAFIALCNKLNQHLAEMHRAHHEGHHGHSHHHDEERKRGSDDRD